MELVWLPGTLCDERVFGDLPGSLDQPARHVRLSDFARVEEAAEAILETLPQTFVPIGFSLGGFVALELLRRAPERVAGLVLLSGNAHPDVPAIAATRRDEVSYVREKGMSALIDRLWPRLVGPASREDAELRRLLIAMAEGIGADGLARQAEMNITRPDLRATAAQASVPLLVVAGAEDRLCPPERYAAAAEGVAGSLETISNAGHFLPLEAPEALAPLIASFVRRFTQ